ncbi:SRPBCC family protein [Nocardia sp. NBC_00565]|uniref:SRPBCC family protein n=1 Tax=Nocardia sp. NBC_00565 TaxID=2975993 RepID=UPI002E807B83|nr:SRPBCC family protein [Nocardia sp. NBC_00565]WUC05575.1 SRPBCC family protein [Nocardia sp. NBC_00565]
MRVRAFKRVSLPIAVVWETLADHEGMSDWSPGIAVTLEREGASERNGVGAVRRVQGPGVTIREEVTGFEVGRWLAYRVLSGLPLRDYRGEVFLSQSDGDTTVTWTLMCENRSAVIRFGLNFYANMFVNALVRTTGRRMLVRQ